MFDTHVFKDGDTRIDVKQLPHDTADAARLYGEMVAKARAEVLGATIREAGAGISAVVKNLSSEANFQNMDTTVRVLFSVNGYDYDIKTTESTLEHDVREKIAQHLVAEIMGSLEKRNGRSLHRR